ncbi:hypothetical protein [Desulfobacter sp.]|uniref:hypothetical protein n=1 Tax=Desulfobacter sp. TaxID=2294 RepID=UPI003D100440
MKKLFEDVKKDMEQLKDEIRLQAHLGKVEARQEFEKLEKKFDDIVARVKPFTDEVEKTAEKTGAALKIAAEELMVGMDRIRKLIK